MTVEELRTTAERAFKSGEVSWGYADEDQSTALGLPPQTGGWGLLICDAGEGHQVTAACERALVAALEERPDGVAGWDERVRYWARGTPPELGPWAHTGTG